METPQLNEHKQSCDSASAEDKCACVMPSDSKFAADKAEYPPMHTSDFDAAPIVIYTSEDNIVSLDVKLENETVWLSQEQMAALFDRNRTVIGRHINNVFKEGELQKELVCAKIAHTEKLGRWDGRTQTAYTELYNLDVIISVGYRVKSKRGTQCVTAYCTAPMAVNE